MKNALERSAACEGASRLRLGHFQPRTQHSFQDPLDDLLSGQRVELHAQFSLGQRQNPKGNPSKRVATDFTAEDSGLLSRHTSASFANDRVNLRRSETPKTDVRRTVGYSAGR